MPFYKTRMGEKRLASNIADEKRDPAVAELIEYAGYLAQSAERLLNIPIEPGSTESRDAFDLLRDYAAAVRRILTKFD